MELTTAEKIKILCKRKGISLKEMATLTNQTQQNLSNKLRRNNFQEAELHLIADVLGCDFIPTFVQRETGERI